MTKVKQSFRRVSKTLNTTINHLIAVLTGERVAKDNRDTLPSQRDRRYYT